jgi:hypothetical protein
MFKIGRYYSDGKKYPPFWMFIAPIVVFLICFPYLIKRNPSLTVIILVSFATTLILISLYSLYVAFITNSYVQKHDFHLWKKSKSPSLKERQEAGREIMSLVSQTPYLEKYEKHANKIAFVLLTIWTLIFLGIFSLIIFL